MEYYTPSIEEFVLGFKYEQLYEKCDTGTVNRTEDFWLKRVYEIKKVELQENGCEEIIYPQSLKDILELLHKNQIRAIK